MSQFEVKAVSGENFSAYAMNKGRTITAFLKGNADMRARPHLEQFLSSLHGAASGLKVSEVYVDFRDLEFMTSSCFKDFVSWLSVLEAAPLEQQYRISFVADPKSHWQKRSLHALRCFAAKLITVQ
jgi:hypothetical protein